MTWDFSNTTALGPSAIRPRPPFAQAMADAIARGHNVLKKVAARKYPIVAVGAVVVFSAPWLLGWPQVLLGVAATDIVLFARQHFCPSP